MHYFPIYEKHFSRFINQSVVFLEIGVSRGGSLQLWKRYFGPFVTIVGIDIDPKCKEIEEDQIHVRIGDQSDTVFLQSVLDEFGPPDIVLDDGSHVMMHICKTWDYMYDKINENGVYFVEDLHTAYFDDYGGGLKREGTFIERCKDLVDNLHARKKSFAKATYSMSCYDSVVAFEKRRLYDLIEERQIASNPVYGDCFDKFVNRPVVFWMFGTDDSFSVWKQYLGPFAVIVGINDNFEENYTQDGQIYVRVGNVFDAGFLQSIIDEFGSPDAVLDNANCGAENVLKKWELLYDKVSKNGVYLVEGLDSGNQAYNANVFIERCKELLDFLNAKYNELDSSFAGITYNMSFYIDCVAFEKKLMNESAVRAVCRPTIPFTFKERVVNIVVNILKKLGLFNITKKIYRTIFPIKSIN